MRSPSTFSRVTFFAAIAGMMFGSMTTTARAQQSTFAQTPDSLQRGGVSFGGDETVEADVSTRSIAITSGFSGTNIVIFGAVNNTRQTSPESGLYDVVVVIKGKSVPVVTRKKSNVFGLWINTRSVQFANVPSYYTISSTRPLDEIADEDLLEKHRIGFEHLVMSAIDPSEETSNQDLTSFENAIIRLKKNAKLFQKQDYGVAFIGKSLFRSSFNLPPNIPVGPLAASVYLFRDGQLLARFNSTVTLKREGLQLFLYDLAFNHSLLYGLIAVILAVLAGLSASAVFGRKVH